MKEQLVSVKTAKLAQEKGFNVPCRGYLHISHFHLIKKNIIPDNVPTHDNEIFAPIVDHNHRDSAEFHRINPKFTDPVYDRLSMPTQSLLQKWLREKYNIRIFVTFECIDDSEYAYVWNIVTDTIKGREKDSWDFYNRVDSFGERMIWWDTYEGALEGGLYESLKLIP